MISCAWAVDGQRLLFESAPSGGELAVLGVTLRAREHTGYDELLFFGREDVARFGEAATRSLVISHICTLKANSAGSMDEMNRWLAQSRFYELRAERQIKEARRNHATAIAGTSGTIQTVWPYAQ